MNIVPKASPTSNQSGSQPSPQQDARARAMAKFMGEALVPRNQNSIQPEETVQTSNPDMPLEIPQPDLSALDQIPTETAPPQAPTAPPVEDPLSKQYAALVKREKAIRAHQAKQEQDYKTREEALKLREQEIQSKSSQYEQGWIQKDRIKQNTLGVLAEAGISYDELTQQVLNQQPENPRVTAEINSLKDTIQKLTDKLDGQQKQSEQSQQQQYQSAIKQLTADTKALVATDPSYEMIMATGSVKDVVDLIEQTYRQDGVVMSVEDAAQEVENYLIEEALKLANTKKVQQKLRPPVASTATQAQTPSQSQTQVQPKQPQMKTLTNAVASSRKLSARDRAIAAFQGKLSG